MAKLTREDILKLARLSRLHLYDQDISRYQEEISVILGYVEQLQSVDLDDLSPTYQVTGLSDVMRKDEPIDYGATPKELLKNLPSVENNQIKVRRVL